MSRLCGRKGGNSARLQQRHSSLRRCPIPFPTIAPAARHDHVLVRVRAVRIDMVVRRAQPRALIRPVHPRAAVAAQIAVTIPDPLPQIARPRQLPASSPPLALHIIGPHLDRRLLPGSHCDAVRTVIDHQALADELDDQRPNPGRCEPPRGRQRKLRQGDRPVTTRRRQKHLHRVPEPGRVPRHGVELRLDLLRRMLQPRMMRRHADRPPRCHSPHTSHRYALL